MNLIYRGDLNRNLTSLEADSNIRQLAQAVANGGTSLIDVEVDQAARTITFFMSDSTAIGPIQLPAGGGSGGISHAPSNGAYHASRNGAWVAFVPGVPDAPLDGETRGLKNGEWVIIQSGGASPLGVLRHRGDWVSFASYARGDVVDHDGMSWLCRDDYGTTAPAPSLANDGFNHWRCVSLPSDATTSAATHRLLHRFVTVGAVRTGTVALSSIVNEYEERLQDLAAKLADHEARIAALET